jgi:hypothetical protein
MPREKAEPKRTCPGGLSYNRLRHEHKLGKIEDVLCFRCHKRMGCSGCCERAKNLICLLCHDWATKQALGEHGRMVAQDKREDAMKIVVMAYEGKVTEPEADLLFEQLWRI